MAAPLYTTASGRLWHAGNILIICVGLPGMHPCIYTRGVCYLTQFTARGKTHISRAIERYLRWMGVKIKVFSLGDYRRRMLGGAQQLPHDYFTLGECSVTPIDRGSKLEWCVEGEKSPETAKLRTSIREGCEQMVIDFFQKERGQVAIYDANNGTKKSRQAVGERFEALGVHVIFLGKRRHIPFHWYTHPKLESMCDNQDIVLSNIRSVKISSPDVSSNRERIYHKITGSTV